MELTDSSGDPSPALTRGLQLLQLLCRDGHTSLEKLAQTTGWPKSSVFRLLASLEAFGAIERDKADRRYRACLRLVPFAPVADDMRARATAELRTLCNACGHTVELFAWSDGELVMLDRCEPEGREVAVRARIGWRPDMTELFALPMAALAWGADAVDTKPLKLKFWYWQHGVRKPVPATQVREHVQSARAAGITMCLSPNFHGVRRYVVPLWVGETTRAFWGVLSIAAVPAPPKGPVHELLTRLALAAANRLNRAWTASAVS